MPATIITSGDELNPRLSISGNLMSASADYDIEGCEGDTPIERLADALTAAGLPTSTSTLTVLGRVLYVESINVTPWAGAEARVSVTWKEPRAIEDVTISGGATVEMVESEFDYAAMGVPFASRTPIQVQYNPSGTTPNTTFYPAQTARVQYPIVRCTISYTRTETSDPSGVAEAYSACRNATTWKGRAAGTAFMASITFSQTPGQSLYRVTYTVAFDPLGKWQQAARFRLPNGTFPKLTAADLANQNGMKEVTVAGDVEFNDLDL